MREFYRIRAESRKEAPTKAAAASSVDIVK